MPDEQRGQPDLPSAARRLAAGPQAIPAPAVPDWGVRRYRAVVPAPGLLPYTVNSPLWSDGALKSRWMALPDGGKIGIAEKGEWSFPNGSVFVKHFDLPTDETHPETRRRLETRLLVRDASGAAYGVTYKWRPDNSDADLVTDASTEDIAIRTAAGTTRKQGWYFPSQNDCLRCHTPAAGYVLAPRRGSSTAISPMLPARRTTSSAPGTTPACSTRRSMNRKSPASTSSCRWRMQPLRWTVACARYLDSNCAQCHRPGGVHALWDAVRHGDRGGIDPQCQAGRAGRDRRCKAGQARRRRPFAAVPPGQRTRRRDEDAAAGAEPDRPGRRGCDSTMGHRHAARRRIAQRLGSPRTSAPSARPAMPPSPTASSLSQAAGRTSGTTPTPSSSSTRRSMGTAGSSPASPPWATPTAGQRPAS